MFQSMSEFKYVEEGRELEILKKKLIKRLDDLHSDQNPWDVDQGSLLNGCGLTATRNIKKNELIFFDRAIVLGPRKSNMFNQNYCVMCFQKMSKLTLCEHGCRLPICALCVDTKDEVHAKECSSLRQWEYTTFNKHSKLASRNIGLIRFLLLHKEEKKELKSLCWRQVPSDHNMEVETLLKEFKYLPTKYVDELKIISDILNTNAFETVAFEDVSLRGLFPLAAIMNHSCVPNVRYTFDENHLLRVYACTAIKKGEQLLNNFSSYFAPTYLRRAHLETTRRFTCTCRRCVDPTEIGTFLAALKCDVKTCNGQLLPINSVTPDSEWACDTCLVRHDCKKVGRFQKFVSPIKLSILMRESVTEIFKFLRKNIRYVILESNYFIVEAKLAVMYRMLDMDKYQIEDYMDQETYCWDILNVIDRLRLGDCYLKAIVCYCLFKVREKIYTLNNCDHETFQREVMFLEKCKEIMGHGTLTCPKDLPELLEKYKVDIEANLNSDGEEQALGQIQETESETEPSSEEFEWKESEY